MNYQQYRWERRALRAWASLLLRQSEATAADLWRMVPRIAELTKGLGDYIPIDADLDRTYVHCGVQEIGGEVFKLHRLTDPAGAARWLRSNPEPPENYGEAVERVAEECRRSLVRQMLAGAGTVDGREAWRDVARPSFDLSRGFLWSVTFYLHICGGFTSTEGNAIADGEVLLRLRLTDRAAANAWLRDNTDPCRQKENAGGATPAR